MKLKQFFKPTLSKVILALLLPIDIGFIEGFFIAPIPLIITLPLNLFGIGSSCSICSELSCLACVNPVKFHIMLLSSVMVTVLINYLISCLIIKLWNKKKKRKN